MELGNILGKAVRGVVGAVTGGLSERVIELVEDAVGDGMSPEQKAQLKIALDQEVTKRAQIAEEAGERASEAVTQRAALLEGTANDLKTVPVLGPLMLFLRGAQRPVWGFGTLALDWQILSGVWKVPHEGPIAMAVVIINVLVLGFLFGERTVQNLAPLLVQIFGKKGA